MTVRAPTGYSGPFSHEAALGQESWRTSTELFPCVTVTSRPRTIHFFRVLNMHLINTAPDCPYPPLCGQLCEDQFLSACGLNAPSTHAPDPPTKYLDKHLYGTNSNQNLYCLHTITLKRILRSMKTGRELRPPGVKFQKLYESQIEAGGGDVLQINTIHSL